MCVCICRHVSSTIQNEAESKQKEKEKRPKERGTLPPISSDASTSMALRTQPSAKCTLALRAWASSPLRSRWRWSQLMKERTTLGFLAVITGERERCRRGWETTSATDPLGNHRGVRRWHRHGGWDFGRKCVCVCACVRLLLNCMSVSVQVSFHTRCNDLCM